jgi:hypothetical protein
MHRSRLAGFIIDCRDTAPDEGARFWGSALGMKAGPDDTHGYAELHAGPRDLHIEVQNVKHESRVHLDIETDNQAAEVARLEKLGAKQVGKGPRWVVMEAPTGQRFCVVNPQGPLENAAGVNVWP